METQVGKTNVCLNAKLHSDFIKYVNHTLNTLFAHFPSVPLYMLHGSSNSVVITIVFFVSNPVPSSESFAGRHPITNWRCTLLISVSISSTQHTSQFYSNINMFVYMIRNICCNYIPIFSILTKALCITKRMYVYLTSQ